MDTPVSFMEPGTQTLLEGIQATMRDLVVAADHAFEFEHWPDAFVLYSQVEQRTLTTGAPVNGHVCYRVGVMYERGNHVPKNSAIALRYFKQALQYLMPVCQTDPEARCDLAYMLENGYGVQEDKEKAVEYYRIAAEQGYPRAQVNLGYMYSNAYGVECDKAQAVKYYQMAADQGYTNAYTNLGYMYSNGYGIPQDKKIAVKYYKKAAKRGYARGLCNLGYMYDYGYGITQSKSEAAKYYYMAAVQGYSVAQCNLAYMFEHGHGVPLEKTKAVYYYQQAAAQAYPRALCNLAEMYSTGDKEAGIQLDKRKAVQYIVSAADQDYERAKNHLEQMLEGISRDGSDIQKLTFECLADTWPSLTMINNKFKNPLINTYLQQVFKGQGEFEPYRYIAVFYLVKEWPSKRAQAILNPNCKIAMCELCLVLKNCSLVPVELHPLVMKALIGLWQNHFQNTQEESFCGGEFAKS